MKIYTTYFAKVKDLPRDVIPIAVCLYPPRGWTGLGCSQLAPTTTVFYKYKSTGDFDTFAAEYIQTTLGHISVQECLAYLSKCSGGRDVALVCFEKNPDECHRSILAAWFEYNGISVSEWNYTR